MRFHLSSLIAAACLLAVGCGQIIDKDNIVIAKIDDKNITRGDLSKLLREMPDNQRPTIRNKGDLLQVLNQYIDDQIKIPLGQQLAEQGKLRVTRDMARAMYFQQAGEEGQMLQSIWNMEVPPAGQTTPLMDVYNLTPASLRARKDFIEQETDILLEKMQGDEAVGVLALEALQKGELEVDPTALEQEYNVRKADLQTLESMQFIAIRFPAELENASQRAADIRKRIDAGESFDALLDEVLQENPSFAMESEIENNPNLDKFKGFWSSASGAEKDTIVGPVFLPEYQQVNPQTGQAQVMPASWLVLKVLEHRPQRTLTLEEARQQLAAPLLIAQQMKRLREQHGVEIYEDKLPDPQEYAGKSKMVS